MFTQRLDFRASRTAGAFSFFVELFDLLGHENVTRETVCPSHESAARSFPLVIAARARNGVRA